MKLAKSNLPYYQNKIFAKWSHKIYLETKNNFISADDCLAELRTSVHHAFSGMVPDRGVPHLRVQFPQRLVRG